MIDDGDQALLFWLASWARWMRNAQSELPGQPSVASGFANAVSNYAVASEDGDTYWEVHFVPHVLSAIDSAIDSLPEPQRQAIWYRYGLTRIEPRLEASKGFAEAFSAVRLLVLQRVAIAA